MKPEKIKDIYNDTFAIENLEEKDRVAINYWYLNLINKTICEVDLFDTTRMLIQKVYLELAIEKSIQFIVENPFCGQRYEGELLELLSKINILYLNSYKDMLIKILLDALEKNKTYEWLHEDEKIEFKELANKFKEKLSEN